MNPSTNQLSPGFITVDDGCALIKSDTREKPVVDMDYLIAHTDWIETRHNFRIPRIRMLKPEDVRRTKRGKIIEYEEVGNAYVYVATNYEKELLKKTIYDKYRELVGHEYKALGVRARSTVADDAQGKAAVQPRNNMKPIAKEGAVISGGEVIQTNGDGIQV